MSKSDLSGPADHYHKRDSIEAHLTIVFARRAVNRWLEHETEPLPIDLQNRA
jgi:hypothetical protein